VAGRSTVGLDIGTSGVRAAEVSFGKGPATLERFGQVSLPAGAVRGGEVVDSDPVAVAIKQLWAQAKFSSKKVVVGVANQKVVVRQVDLPWLPTGELRASLSFQAQEYIPMPVEQAILDFHPLEEFENESGGRMLRVLLVAAAREMVNGALEAVTKAGLRPVMVDLNPFAVLRSLATQDDLGLAGVDAEALVDIGASVTNIVIHQGGVPRFVRILLMGGADVTEAVAERMGVPVDRPRPSSSPPECPQRPESSTATRPDGSSSTPVQPWSRRSAVRWTTTSPSPVRRGSVVSWSPVAAECSGGWPSGCPPRPGCRSSTAPPCPPCE